jgi:hypothetical protein
MRISKLTLYRGSPIEQALLKQELQRLSAVNSVSNQNGLENRKLVEHGALEGQVAIDPRVVNDSPQLGNLSQAVPRLITSVCAKEGASGSAVCIHPSGLFLSANHTTEKYHLGVRELLDEMGPYGGGFPRNPFDPKSYSMRSTLHANIPIINKGNVRVHSVPLQLLDYDPNLDISILQAMNLPFTTRIFTSVELSDRSPNPGDKTFKVGHTFGSVVNLVAQGEVKNINSSDVNGDIHITSKGDQGDSGGGVFDEDAKLTAILHLKSRKIADHLIGASVTGQIEPYLREVLGIDNYKRIVDKADLKIDKAELRRRNPGEKEAIEIPSCRPPMLTLRETGVVLQQLVYDLIYLGDYNVRRFLERFRK